VSAFAALCAVKADTVRPGGADDTVRPGGADDTVPPGGADDTVRPGGAGASPRVRRHHSRKVSGAGAGSSRDIVQPASGPGALEMVLPPPNAAGAVAGAPLARTNGRAAVRASFCARS
jgi:hypothetical protein